MSQVGLEMSEERTVRRRERRRGGVAVVLALLLVVGLLGAGYLGATTLLGKVRGGPAEAVEDYPGPGGAEVVVEVKSGETATDIAKRLADTDVVASADAFVQAAQADAERASSLQPGFYRLKQQMSGADAFERLLDPAARAEAQVTVPEGLRLSETLATLSKGTGIPTADFHKALASGGIGLPPYAKGKAEGFLFPARYDVPPDAKAADVLELMTQRFDQAAKKAGIGGSRARSPLEVVTIASLVEAEADGPADFGKVARVIYNRLDRGIALQFDSTINYANGEDKKVVSHADIARAADSPYSTYEHPGLPPGPIGSPGEKALIAAENPPPGDWLYFVTTNLETGETKFTSSYNEFLRFKAELKRNVRQG